jgi:hypothetical protein
VYDRLKTPEGWIYDDSQFGVRCLLAAGLYAQNQQPTKTHLKEGDMAPDFTLTATTGGQVKLSDFRGTSNVVLAFFPAAFYRWLNEGNAGVPVWYHKI